MSAANSRPFDHVVIIMFENEYRSYVRENAYMDALAGQGLDLTASFGVMHPSNTNYVASIAGEICNISDDPFFYTLMRPGCRRLLRRWCRRRSPISWSGKVSGGRRTWRDTSGSSSHRSCRR
jgi:hypothetical protein